MPNAVQSQPESHPAVLSKAVCNAAGHLGLANLKLAKILGLSPATISRLNAGTYQLAPDRKEWEFAILLVRLFRSLDSISGGSPETAKAWLQSGNLALAGKKPVELIESTEGIVHVVTYLDACRAIV